MVSLLFKGRTKAWKKKKKKKKKKGEVCL